MYIFTLTFTFIPKPKILSSITKIICATVLIVCMALVAQAGFLTGAYGNMILHKTATVSVSILDCGIKIGMDLTQAEKILSKYGTVTTNPRVIATFCSVDLSSNSIPSLCHYKARKIALTFDNKPKKCKSIEIVTALTSADPLLEFDNARIAISKGYKANLFGYQYYYLTPDNNII